MPSTIHKSKSEETRCTALRTHLHAQHFRKKQRIERDSRVASQKIETRRENGQGKEQQGQCSQHKNAITPLGKRAQEMLHADSPVSLPVCRPHNRLTKCFMTVIHSACLRLPLSCAEASYYKGLSSHAERSVCCCQEKRKMLSLIAHPI